MPSLQEALAEALEDTELGKFIERRDRKYNELQELKHRKSGVDRWRRKNRETAIEKCEKEFEGKSFDEIKDIVLREYKGNA